MTAAKNILIQSLINNQLFDAALSAMGYAMMGLAVRENKELLNTDRYFQSGIQGFYSPDNSPEISFESKLVDSVTLEGLLQRADDLVVALGQAWEQLLSDPDHAVVWDSIRVAFVPGGGGSMYNLILVYCVTAASYKGKSDGE